MVILRDSNKIQKLKKIGSNTMMGGFPLGLFIYVYLICNKIETEAAQILYKRLSYYHKHKIYWGNVCIEKC